ncbi:MAG: hypothetical protein L0L17_10600 [Yaniella sp.]|nr:hypothetical protein [Yaniella sp.]
MADFYLPKHNKVDRFGKVTVRYAGRLRHLGIGTGHRGTRVLLLIHDNRVTTSDATTGEILTEHHLDATKDYQAPTWRKPPN